MKRIHKVVVDAPVDDVNATEAIVVRVYTDH